MFLKRIELIGFKSFANKTIIQFDQDITGIVGPNGCGKSNVNDAIRWVLGEQSVKSLRSGSSMTDIIFSGSEYKKPVNMAKVTLVFDNSSHIFDSEFEEIEITRQLQRSNNEASYFINKTPCRLKDINDLVMDTGLGRDSLSIITQGNIASFADAKPEERRSIFEEAAGVAKYKKRKHESLRRLDRTKDNLDRLQDIIDEKSKQIATLEKQAAKAKTFIGLKDELSKIEISVLVEDIESLHDRVMEIQKELLETKAVHVSKETMMNQQEDTIADLRKETYALDRKIAELQEQYTKAMEENYQLEKQKVELDEKRKYALRKEDAKTRQKELQRIIDESRFEYEDRQKRLNSMSQDYKMHQKNLESYKAKENRTSYELRQEREVHQQLLNRKNVLENISKQPYQHQQGVKAIMDAKDSLGGIEGVVSSLLTAQEGYENAINAALGGSIYHIASKDEYSARKAIQFLKKNHSGRATFLPLTVCRASIANDTQQLIASNAKGFIGWASELVECKDRYNTLRDRLLGNILVMDTLENANECAKQLKYQLNIVTLDGDIVHKGGSMTGGYVKNQNTPMTLIRDLRQVESEIAGHALKVENLKQEVSALNRNMDDETASCVQLQIEMAKLENIVSIKKEKYESNVLEFQQLGFELDETKEMPEDDLVVQMSKMHEKIDMLTSNIQTYRQKRYDLGMEVEELEHSIRKQRRQISALQSEIHQLEMQQVEYTTMERNTLERLSSSYSMTFEFARTKKQEINLEEAKQRVSYLRDEISKLGNVNLDAPAEYEELMTSYTFMMKQKEDLELASKQILDAIDEMDKTMIVQFKDMFDKINIELDESFKAMFGGGRAKLKMVDPEDILNTGIDIDVQPPGKVIKNIQTFSGGEKALIAISVLFAILKARTMPLCIFDEVEAALDQANVERFARYLSHFRNQSQFIVVTHRPGTMEQCDTLYGVTMQKDGVSQLLKVQLKDAISYSDKEGE
ncbi:MAG: AAA family ATPase [Holdemanella sp.]|nr:AAA family ATPase [Holdemanella sp.]